MNGYYPNYPSYYPNLVITRVTLLVGFEASSIVGMKLSAFLRRNTLTPMTSQPTVFIPFKLMRRNPIKIRSCAIISWFNQSDRLSNNFKVDKCLEFRVVEWGICNVLNE